MSSSLYVVDASAMFFRAYYAIRPLTSKTGVPTNAVFGYLSMLVKLLNDVKPEYLAICYDLPGPSFRVDMDPNYKANRSETPEDLQQQIPYLKKLTELMGLPAFEKEKYEADDLIGSLARYGTDKGLKVVIVSGDKDFAQLINDDVSMWDTMKNVTYTPDKVVEKWGVRAEQFIDYLAIVGDSSDNVPGVRGIGPKGAQKLFTDYSTLDEIYENVDAIKGANQKKLIQSKEDAYLSQKLVTIVTDLEIVSDLDELKRKGPNEQPLRDLLQELSFSKFEKQLLGTQSEASSSTGGTSESASATSSARVTSSISAGPQVQLQEVTPQNWTTVFPEQSSVHVMKTADRWIFSNEKNCAVVNEVSGEFSEIWNRADHDWIGYDVKKMWHEMGVKNPRCSWDHMMASYVVEAKDAKSFENLVENAELGDLSECEDVQQWVRSSFQLKEHLDQEMDRVNGEGVFRGLEMPLIPILFQMEKRGIRLDSSLLAGQSEELAAEIEVVEKEVYKHADEEFNIASPKQLAPILFEKLGLPKGKKTKTGYSTDNDVLQKLLGVHPIAESVLKFRELTKLKSTYVDALPELVDSEGRLHTHFRQGFTATGRLSSINPNLQNIPIRTERGARVRQAFVASPDMVMASVDYSQIELRILAHITADPGLCKAFESDLDIHQATAAEIYGVGLSDVSSLQRRNAKAVNFGIAYGQGAFGLAETLGISRTEAKEIIQRYFEKFPGVKDYMSSVVEDAKSRGFVETLFGRRRYLDELKAKNPAIKKFGERAAINAPIQGTAADLVKKAMIKTFGQGSLHMLLQVHDELIFEGSVGDMETHMGAIAKTMESVADLSVPLKVNANIGKNWDEAH